MARAPLNTLSHSSSVASDQRILGVFEADLDAWMIPANLALKTLAIAPLPYMHYQPWPTVFEQGFEESNLTVPPFVPPPAVGDTYKSATSITGTPSIPHNYEGGGPYCVSKSTSRLYGLPVTSSQRGCRLPAALYEPNIRKLQQRLTLEGGDREAIKLVERVFSKGVTMETLMRRLTREETALHTFGCRAGPIYLAFLEPIPSPKKQMEPYLVAINAGSVRGMEKRSLGSTTVTC